MLKVINKTQSPQRYELRLVDAEGFALNGKTAFVIPAGEMSELPVSVALLADRPTSSAQQITFEVRDSDEPTIYSRADSRFVAPLNR